MKTLIIGMDGAQISTFLRGWTPYIASLIEKGDRLHLEEDIISRGWAEIFTGKHGLETGALYDRPLMNKSLDWTNSFGLKDIPGLGGHVKPLWQVLNQNGIKVGIMNVPTTSPCPEVNGFFVSGGGGGNKIVQEVPEDKCYPRNIVSVLRKNRYILDERLPSLVSEKKITTAKKLFERIDVKNHRRVVSFIELADQFDVDLGFVVFRSSTVLAEMFTIPEYERVVLQELYTSSEMLEAAQRYYASFDGYVKKLCEHYNDAEVILVSDHSMHIATYKVNLNKILCDNDFQDKRALANTKSSLSAVKRIMKPFIPVHVRSKLRSSGVAKKMYDSHVVFNQKTSKAFCVTYGEWSRGIYINDVDRFGGPVLKAEMERVVQKICSVINTDVEAKKHNIIAIATERTEDHGLMSFPDILVKMPDGYIVSNEASDFVEKFEFPEGEMNLKLWIKDYRDYCIKGYRPIAVTSGKWQLDSQESFNDLRDVYTHVVKSFGI